MTTHTDSNLIARWSRLGVFFNASPAPKTLDLERLLLDTARDLGHNARLAPLTVTWLAAYGHFVARHRLKRLITAELESEHQAALGLLLESAIEHGAPRDLRVAVESCRPAVLAGPLFEAYRGKPALETLAETSASPLSRKWRVWASPIELKPDAIRPVDWVLRRNPLLRARAIRRGDLRCSILESLRLDSGGRVNSETELARLTGATRLAVSRALDGLVQEGEVIIGKRRGNERSNSVSLLTAA